MTADSLSTIANPDCDNLALLWFPYQTNKAKHLRNWLFNTNWSNVKKEKAHVVKYTIWYNVTKLVLKRWHKPFFFSSIRFIIRLSTMTSVFDSYTIYWIAQAGSLFNSLYGDVLNMQCAQPVSCQGWGYCQNDVCVCSCPLYIPILIRLN